MTQKHSSVAAVVSNLKSGQTQLMAAHARRVTAQSFAPHRQAMVQRLRQTGIIDPQVLKAMSLVPRHLFVQAAVQNKAYEDLVLPIGAGQTISRPSIVALMLQLLNQNKPQKVLEIGTGCGYQAAVMGHIFPHVVTIERIKRLYTSAVARLKSLSIPHQLQVKYADGCLGAPEQAPFGGIILAAAGVEVPRTLLRQLEIGGVLVAPVGDKIQHLVCIKRISEHEWTRKELQTVSFVALQSGTVI